MDECIWTYRSRQEEGERELAKKKGGGRFTLVGGRLKGRVLSSSRKTKEISKVVFSSTRWVNACWLTRVKRPLGRRLLHEVRVKNPSVPFPYVRRRYAIYGWMYCSREFDALAKKPRQSDQWRTCPRQCSSVNGTDTETYELRYHVQVTVLSR